MDRAKEHTVNSAKHAHAHNRELHKHFIINNYNK